VLCIVFSHPVSGLGNGHHRNYKGGGTTTPRKHRRAAKHGPRNFRSNKKQFKSQTSIKKQLKSEGAFWKIRGWVKLVRYFWVLEPRVAILFDRNFLEIRGFNPCLSGKTLTSAVRTLPACPASVAKAAAKNSSALMLSKHDIELRGARVATVKS
jgi:hypothetical protein